MRIVSLLPSATEILFALGLGDSVVGVTHECDFPAAAKTKTAMIQPRVDPEASPAEIDARVRELVERGESVYSVREDLLREARPDLIITQDLCHVCAASPDDLGTVLAKFPTAPRVLSLSPHCLADVWDDIRRVGEATGTRDRAEALASERAAAVARVRELTRSVSRRPRVACIEWLEPLYVGGHWVPEMVEIAGGVDCFGDAAKASFRISMEEFVAAAPEMIVVMVCGYDVKRAMREMRAAGLPGGWRGIPAVASGAVFATDANGYFSRPGPRLVEGIALLVSLFHPELSVAGVPADACEIAGGMPVDVARRGRV